MLSLDIPEIQDTTGKTLQLVEVLVERAGTKAEKQSHATFEKAEQKLDQSHPAADPTTATQNELCISSSTPTEQNSNMPEDEHQSKPEACNNSEEGRVGPPEHPSNPLHNDQDDTQMVERSKSTEAGKAESDPTAVQTASIWDPQLVAALRTAAAEGATAVIELLLATGVDVNALSDGMTALGTAIYWGHASSVEVLLKAGADPTLAGKGKEPPLVLAARRGRADIVQMLLAHRR